MNKYRDAHGGTATELTLTERARLKELEQVVQDLRAETVFLKNPSNPLSHITPAAQNDKATTHHQRAIGSEDTRKGPRIRIYAEFKRVRPAAQSMQILALTDQLETLSLAKKPAAVKPVVNHAFNR